MPEEKRENSFLNGSSLLEDLRLKIRGDLLTPGDAGYEEARTIWNAMIDRKPKLILRCLGPSDVIHGVNFARDNNLLLAIKGGGHNVAGNAVCQDGMMLDLSRMRSVEVNPVQQTVRADAGCLLSDIDKETQLYGLAISGGIVSHTGVAGLTLGGGFGWISRKHGFTVDNLISVEIVTADGKLLTVSEDQNPDLFWGIRGGGGNFGVVVSFKFKCAHIGTNVYSGLIIQRFEDAKAYLKFHAEYVRTLPDDMTVWLVIRHAPPLPFLDASVHGRMVLVVAFAYLGGPEKGWDLIQPLRKFGKPHGEALGMNPWIAWQSGFDGLNTHGGRNYWKSHHLTELSNACLDKVIEFAGKMPTSQCEIFIPHMEGVPSRVPEEATAYTFRSSPFVLNIHTRWDDSADDKRCIAWAKDLFNDTKKFSNGVYVNFLSDEGEQRVKDAYTSAAWQRLVQLKDKYDPHNLFRMNQNIHPSV